MARTDWSRLDSYIAGLNLQVGQTVRLTASDLHRVLGVSALPSFTNRVTAWDPVMGKPGGLQRVVSDHALFPTAFEWQGSTAEHPALAAVTLVKWGGLARSDAEHP